VTVERVCGVACEYVGSPSQDWHGTEDCRRTKWISQKTFFESACFSSIHMSQNSLLLFTCVFFFLAIYMKKKILVHIYHIVKQMAETPFFFFSPNHLIIYSHCIYDFFYPKKLNDTLVFTTLVPLIQMTWYCIKCCIFCHKK